MTPNPVLKHSVLCLQMDVTDLPQWSEIVEVIRSVPCFTVVGRRRHAAEYEVDVNTTIFVEEGQQ